ncbi:hypothetical protein FDP41_010509 [Naegleria fowleri]|uniref:Pentacotripeptide-repeat region of PRORP domain-containing protein n=1 Tax=Naegleria fowleri TaxID=5763 RepID=A0A6A5CA81_NAEFO|nr:uncharacterized protein FDP41_010509 [Naegleria fowleri]KAF0983444.1 hypothetical protein FDP41_010509 [Naegleria fowleri]CAG4713232.1 unnamed protein product [Naegleria fowleri]
MLRRGILDAWNNYHHHHGALTILTNSFSPRFHLSEPSSLLMPPKTMIHSSHRTPSAAWYHQSCSPSQNTRIINKQSNNSSSPKKSTTNTTQHNSSINPDVAISHPSLLAHLEILFQGMSYIDIQHIPPTVIDEQVTARLEKALLDETQTPENKLEIFESLIRANQVQYLPHLLDLTIKNNVFTISYGSYVRELVLKLERKGSYITNHPEEHSKEILNICSKCIDLIIATNYSFVQDNNVDAFLFILTLRVRMFKHSKDFPSLKKYFENQMKPLMHKFMTHPTSLCKLYNTITTVLIELDQLDYLFEEIYANNMTTHYNLLKRGKGMLKGTPLFVTIHSLLNHPSRSVALSNFAAKLSILAVEFFDMAKRDTKIDNSFMQSLHGTFIVSFAEHFNINRQFFQPLRHYFSLYLNFVSYFWNFHRDVTNPESFGFVSSRFLFLYARLAHESAFDISSSREAEYVYEQLVTNNIPLTDEMYSCLFVIFSHTRNEKKCVELYENALLTCNSTTARYHIHQALINAYSIMGDFEKAFALASTMKNITIGTGNILLKAITIMCLPNLKNNYTDDYIQSCIERTLQLLNEQKVEFDGITMNTLINIYGSTNKLPTMLKYFQLLVDGYNEGKYGFLNAITFTTIMKHLCANQQFDSALDMFKKMKELSITPTTVTYKVLIEGMILSGQDCLQFIMQHMKQDGINMEDHLIGSIVFYYSAKTEDEKQLMDVLKVVDRHRDEYTPKVYEHLVLFYARFQNWKKATRVILQLLDKGITPTIRTFSHLIQRMAVYMDAFDLLHILHPNESDLAQYVAQREAGELDDLRDALFTKEMDHGCGLAILKSVLEKANFQQFQTKVQMHSRNHYMNRHSCAILFYARQRNLGLQSSYNLVEILIDLFEDMDCIIFEQASFLMLSLMKAEGGSAKVLSIYEKLCQRNTKFDVRSFNVVLECILTMEGENAVWNFYDETIMSKKRFAILPDLNTLELLIRAARNENDFEMILKNYKQMTTNTRYFANSKSESILDLREEMITRIKNQLAAKEQSLYLSNNVLYRIKTMKEHLDKAEIFFMEQQPTA